MPRDVHEDVHETAGVGWYPKPRVVLMPLPTRVLYAVTVAGYRRTFVQRDSVPDGVTVGAFFPGNLGGYAVDPIVVCCEPFCAAV